MVFVGETKVKPASLRKAATHSDELQAGIRAGVDQLDAQHSGLSAKADGFAFVEELMRVKNSWSDRLGDVRKECGWISHMLRETANNHDENEEEVASSFKAEAGQSTVDPRMNWARSSVDSNPFG